MTTFKNVNDQHKYAIGDVLYDTGEFFENHTIITDIKIIDNVPKTNSLNMEITHYDPVTNTTYHFLYNSARCGNQEIIKNLPNFSKENYPEYFI